MLIEDQPDDQQIILVRGLLAPANEPVIGFEIKMRLYLLKFTKIGSITIVLMQTSIQISHTSVVILWSI